MQKPVIAKSARLFEGAVVNGNVTLGENVGIWPNAVLRGDLGETVIGDESNIQDGTVVHNDTGGHTHVGRGVTVGHLCILHGCEIGDDSLIGMGSVLMNDVKIGKECIIGAGSLLTQGTVVPDGMMAMGRPAKVKRPLTDEEKQANRRSAQHYVELMNKTEERAPLGF